MKKGGIRSFSFCYIFCATGEALETLVDPAFLPVIIQPVLAGHKWKHAPECGRKMIFVFLQLLIGMVCELQQCIFTFKLLPVIGKEVIIRNISEGAGI